MGCRSGAILATLVIGLALGTRPAVADIATVRVVVPGDLAALSR